MMTASVVGVAGATRARLRRSNQRVASSAQSAFAVSDWDAAANSTATVGLSGTIRYDDATPAANANVSVSATRMTIAAEECYVSVDKTVFDADGVDSVTVTLQIKFLSSGESYGLQGIPASEIAIAVTGGTGNTVTQPASATDANGVTSGSFVSTSSGTKTITATVCGVSLAPVQVTSEGGGVIIPPSSGDPFFEENFAGLQVNNANGFTWNTGKNTAIVSFDGFNCMRFRYEDAGSSSGPNAERRYNMGRDVTHLWMEYDVHIPSNFSHPNTSVNNNKWMMIWREVYSDVTDGTHQFGFEFRTNSSEAPGSEIRAMARRWDYNFMSSSGPNYTPSGQFNTFINAAGPVVIGDWNQIRMEFKIASNSTAEDGIQRMWVNGVLFVEITTGRFWNYPASVNTPADCFLRNGYFFGTANSGYNDIQTDFHIKAVKFYDTDPGWIP